MTETEQARLQQIVERYKGGKTFGRKAGEQERGSVLYPVAFARFQAALNEDGGMGNGYRACLKNTP